MAGKTYSKDEKQKREIEGARNYNTNWAKKRKDLLRKNMQEMMQAYPISTIPAFNYLANNLAVPIAARIATNIYLNDRVKGYQNATVYGDPEAFMAYNPSSAYTKNAYEYIQRNGGTKADAFDLANAGLNGASFRSNGQQRIYLKQGRSGSAAHELWHVGTKSTGLKSYTQIGSSYKYDPIHFATVKYLKQDPYIQDLINKKQLNWDKPVPAPLTVNNQNYMWAPDEVLARRAALMHYLNWDPTKKATLKDVQEWRRKGLLEGQKPLKDNPTFYNTPNVNLNKLSDETILHLINDVALNDTPSQDAYQINDVHYAYKGGLIKKPKK